MDGFFEKLLVGFVVVMMCLGAYVVYQEFFVNPSSTPTVYPQQTYQRPAPQQQAPRTSVLTPEQIQRNRDKYWERINEHDESKHRADMEIIQDRCKRGEFCS